MKKTLLFTASALFISLLCLAPRFATPSHLASIAEKWIKQPIALESVRLSWFGEQAFTGLQIGDAKLDTLIVEAPLYALPFNTSRILRIEKGSFSFEGKPVAHLTKGIFHIKNERITLSEPVKIEGNIAPFGKDIPYTLDIEAEGTSFPMQDQVLQKGVISFGTLTVAPFSYKIPKALRKVAKLLHPNLSIYKKIKIRIEPISFSLCRGTLHLASTEITLQEELSCQLLGSIDLEKEELDLEVHVPGTTLLRLLQMEGTLEDFTLKIPLKGPIRTFSIEEQILPLLIK